MNADRFWNDVKVTDALSAWSTGASLLLASQHLLVHGSVCGRDLTEAAVRDTAHMFAEVSGADDASFDEIAARADLWRRLGSDTLIAACRILAGCRFGDMHDAVLKVVQLAMLEAMVSLRARLSGAESLAAVPGAATGSEGDAK